MGETFPCKMHRRLFPRNCRYTSFSSSRVAGESLFCAFRASRKTDAGSLRARADRALPDVFYRLKTSRSLITGRSVRARARARPSRALTPHDSLSPLEVKCTFHRDARDFAAERKRRIGWEQQEEEKDKEERKKRW